MKTASVYASFTLALALACGCDRTPEAGGTVTMDEEYKASLNAIKDSRIFFGHQSVGGNILRELQAVVKEEGLEGPKVVEFRPEDTAAAGIIHAFVGENNRPDSKCADFAKSIEKAGGGFDAAVLKFCYVDFNSATDAAAMVEAYAKTLEGLKAGYPGMVFVHVTVPLKASEGLKSLIKKALGRANPEADNVRRNQYNELLVQRFKGEPIFDLAKVESTRPDGSRETFTQDGKAYYRLAGQYTEDGGHLNAAGGRRAAREMVKVLASALKTRTAGSPGQMLGVGG